MRHTRAVSGNRRGKARLALKNVNHPIDKLLGTFDTPDFDGFH
jgi:hypothetical protein